MGGILRWGIVLVALGGTVWTAQAAPRRVVLPHRVHALQMRMGKFTIPPAREREVCEYRQLPNKKPMDVQEFEIRMSPGSHHFVLWAYFGGLGPKDFPAGIKDSPGCTGIGPGTDYHRANLTGMGQPNGKVSFPQGYALRLEPHQSLLLNSHYINSSATEPLTPQVVFNLVRARKSTVKHHLQTLTLGDYQIPIPAHSTTSHTGEWHAPFDLTVEQLSSHQHKRGIGLSANLIVDGEDRGEIFRNLNDWQEPTIKWFDDRLGQPPIHLKQGDGFRFTCSWQNNDDKDVRFGVTTDDEMCFLTGYYYIADEAAPPAPRPGCFEERALSCFSAPIN